MKLDPKVIIGAVVVLATGAFLLTRERGPVIEELPSDSSIQASLAVSPERPKAGEESVLAFSFTNQEGNPVSELMTHHARQVHVLLVSEDLETLGHIHPEDFAGLAPTGEGEYSVRYTFPRAGRYIVGVDVMTAEDSLAKQFLVRVGGSPRMGKVQEDYRTEKCFSGYAETGPDRYVDPVVTAEAEVECPEGYKITLSLPETVKAGEPVRLTYRVERDGKPVTDLEPYLDAAIHFAVVPTGLETLLHRHGNPAGMQHSHDKVLHAVGEAKAQTHEGMAGMDSAMGEMDSGMQGMEGMSHGEAPPEAFGPELVSEPIILPARGVYKIFAQVKHEGKIIFADFMVNVAESFDREAAQTFDLTISERSLSPEIVTVNQGEGVILRVRTDEAGEFHVAGYELEKKMDVDGVTEVLFTADKAGRYNLELHPEGSDEDLEIGALVVNPR